MVFESVIADLLNKVLGDYIENLDRKQLKIGIWGGDVVLQNLKIRENALEELDVDLPVQLVYGYLGKLVLKIPWKNLYSQPVIVEIDNLHTLVCPKQDMPYDPVKEARYELQVKQAALKALTDATLKEMGKDKPKPDAGFAEKLTAQIVNNLQVKITNVHVRYEDTITTGSPFSFGISLHELELFTTNTDWERCYVSKQVRRVFKIANLSCLAAYMNCSAKLYSSHSKTEMGDLFQLSIARKDYIPPNFSYVLGPISCNSKLKLNINPEYDNPPFEIPKVDLCLEMEKLKIGLTSTQFQNILKLADEMNRLQLGAPYRKYRPINIPYKDHYREWWKFSITAVLEENVRRQRKGWTWEHMKEHRETCNTYAEKYKERQLTKKTPATLIEATSLLEQKLDLFNLILIRQRVDMEIAKIRVNESQVSATKAGWFSGWFSGGQQEENSDESFVKKFEAAMTNDEKAKLYKAIGYKESSAPLDVPEAFEAIKMNFKLIAFEIGLYDDMDKNMDGPRASYDYQELPPIILLKFSMATCSLNQRPAANAISITAGMKEMKMTGLTHEDITPTLIESKITDEFNLLDIFFETNTLDHLFDQRVKIVARPLIITYDAATILRLLKVFTPPPVNLSELEGAASARMANFKQRSATGMQYMIDSHPRLDVDILLMPNIFIIPYGGQYMDGQRTLIVVSLGQIHITTKSDRRSLGEMFLSGERQSSILKSVMENAYDKFNVELDNMQVLVAKANEPWQDILKLSISSELHLLQPTSIQVTAAICVVDDDPRLPKTKVEILIPCVQLNFTEDRIYEVLGVVTSLPVPESEQPTASSVLRKSTMSLGSSMSSFFIKEGKRRISPMKVPLIEDLVQYTSLEVNFALKELSVVLYQSLGVDESYAESPDYSTPPEEQSNINEDNARTLLEVLKIYNSQQILSLEVLQVEANMAQRTYELVASARLGGINIKQFACLDHTEEAVDIIYTPGFSEHREYLLAISYTNADKMSPEFATKYFSTEQLITIDFTTLNITLHQENLKCMLELANNFQQQLEFITDSSYPKDRQGYAGGGDYFLPKLSMIVEDNEGMSKSPINPLKRKYNRRVVESIKLKVIANLHQVGLNLTSRRRPLASMQVKQFDAGVIIKKSYTELNLRLKNIIVTDLNPNTIHTNILSIVGNEALNCQVILYNLEKTRDYNSDDMKITVDIGCMKIIFLNWFVTGVLNFLNNFQGAEKAFVQAGAAAADAAKQNAIDVYENASRIKLNIHIKAPIIVIPVDSNSLNALALDLGMLNLSNTISTIKDPEGNQNAILDDIKLELNDLKLTKATILTTNLKSELSIDDVDAAYGLKTGLNIMNPINFTLRVERNLSSAWYKDLPELDFSGRLKSIELNLLKGDYALIMSILNRNLIEGYAEFPSENDETTVPLRETIKGELQLRPTLRKTTDFIRFEEESKTNIRIKFNFQFDGVIVNLMESTNDRLARFGIYFLSVKGKKMFDGSLSSSIVLCNIQLDDTRKTQKSEITQYLSRKDWVPKADTEEIIEACYNETNYMVDVVAVIKENDTFVRVRVRGFEMIVCIEFLLKVMTFLELPEEAEPIKMSKDVTVPETYKTEYKWKEGSQMLSTPSKISEANVSKMNLTLDIEEPDIILVESLKDLNTNAIIFNAQATLHYRSIGGKQIIRGEINALKMYMCSFLPERREATKHYILHPCVISLQGSTPEEEGLHMSLKFSDIIINVSPATIELLNKAIVTVTASQTSQTAVEKQVDYSNIWKPERFHNKQFWFIKIDSAIDAFEYERFAIARYKTEKCIIEIPSITLVIESGVGYYTTPLISVDTHINAIVSNWSQNLAVDGSLALSINYYNQILAEWEPIIELNEYRNAENVSEYSPWELRFKLQMETVQSEFDEEVEVNTKAIEIYSDSNLETTLSKSCLTLIGELGEAFSQAIDEAGLVKPEVIAPFVVENDTGFEITIDLTRGIFTLHDVHMPNNIIHNTLNTSLIFQASSPTSIVNQNEIKLCTISPGGRAFLQTKDLSTLNSAEDEEYNIYLMIGDITKYVVLPVAKSDKRYFPLMRATNQDPWGIVSEVNCQYGTTKINIHGVVSVKNYFTTNVNIYRCRAENHEMIYVGQVAPDETFHVPLHAIYAEWKELYFSLAGYKKSIQGIRWNDVLSDLEYNRILQCDPIDTFEPLYISATRTKTEVYFEHTNKFKLFSCYYTINLRPPLYLRNALPIQIRVSVAGCSVREGRETKPNLENPVIIGSSSSLVKQDFLDYGEKDIHPGDILHLPTVQFRNKGNTNSSFLVVRLIQYLEKDWSCTTEIYDEETDHCVWVFSSYDSSVKMDINLNVRHDRQFGCMGLTIYSPFWLINKTNLMLTYKTDSESVEVLYHPPEYTGPILFTFREKVFFEKKKLSIRIENGDWSEKIPLDVAGSKGCVSCKADGFVRQIGVHNTLTHNTLTKQITFIPFYILRNKCNFNIEIREESRPADHWLFIRENECEPFWPRDESTQLIVCRVGRQKTAAFNYAEESSTLLKLQDNKYGGINVEVQATEGGVYITFTMCSPSDAPGLLINHTKKPVTYVEKDTKIEHVLEPNNMVLYAWLNPAGERKLVFGKNNQESDLKRDAIGQLVLEDGTKAYWVTFLDGLQRVLLFTGIKELAEKTESSSSLQAVTQTINFRIHGFGLSIINNETGVDIMYLGITSSGIIWESKKENKKRFKQMNIHDSTVLEEQYQQYQLDRSVNSEKQYLMDNKFPIDFKNMKLNKNVVRNLKRSFYPGIWMSIKSSPFQNQVHLKVFKVQLDNQLLLPIFPVVLAPIAPPKSVATTTALKPFIECSVVQRIMQNSSVKQFKYASILIQEFHFKVDLLFLTAIVEMFSGNVTDAQAAKQFRLDVAFIEKQLFDLFESHSAEEQKNFYDNLHLGPLKIHVSFSMAGSDTSALPGILGTLVQGVGVTLTDVNDVVFRLAFFEREYQFYTHKQLISEITNHYTGQALKQLYVLVLGLDVLGNPYGLVVGLKKGVEDLFYEPFQGAIQGPGEFAEGLVLGVKSLFGHTVGGAAGAMSKITGAMGKGLAALTFDEEYQRKRRQALNNKPKNFQEGIARSGKGLVMGFVDGVTGVVTKPVNGAREEGVEGFFKGLGKGAIGLVARPTAGVVDFASGSFDAVKRATESADEVKRLRPSRFLQEDNVLRAYCRAEARGNMLLKEIEKGKYASTDTYVHSEEIVQNKEFLVVSNYRIIYALHNDMFGNWTVQWTYLYSEIRSVTETTVGVEIKLRKEGKKMLGLLSSREAQNKVVLLPTKAQRKKLVNVIESLRK